MIASRRRRWLQLIAGFALFGPAVSLMIRSGLGLGPWDAFHVGLHQLTGITVGQASIVAGLAVLLVSLPLRVHPGVGTVANMILIGVFVDLSLPLIPPAAGAAAALGYYGIGVLLCGFATGMYVGAGLGKGPRDGLMLGLSARLGWPVRRVRTLIELLVLALGWRMGGPIGIGTILFTVSIGPATQWGLARFGALPAGPEPRPVEAGEAA